MTRIEEALLAFIGSGEVLQNPMIMSEQIERHQMLIHNLINDGMVLETDGKLLPTIEGWRFLDHRNSGSPQ